KMAAGEAAGRYRGTVGRSKDPSGLLISVIRTLSSSDDVEDRETEKGRLEEAYEKCDRDLDELIVQHYTELTTAIRTYQSITERITNSRNKIKQVRPRNSLNSCLFYCWLTRTRVIWVLRTFKRILSVALSWYSATPRIKERILEGGMNPCFKVVPVSPPQVSAVDSLEGPLLQVEGLSDLRLELHSKKMNLHLVLIDELHRHLYIKSTNRVGQRAKDRGRIGSLVKDASPVPLMDVTNLSTPRKFLETSQFSTPGSSSMRDSSLLEMKEDPELDPEENSAVFMGILIKGLAKLKKIPETVKAIQDRLEQELKQIVKRSTTQVADSGYQRGENMSQENQPR
ncbi:EXOC4 protein, partial [Pitta sordida]|nr:EXOC4 protein [Pitta sordida]